VMIVGSLWPGGRAGQPPPARLPAPNQRPWASGRDAVVGALLRGRHDPAARALGVGATARRLGHEAARQPRAQRGVGHQLGEGAAVAALDRREEAGDLAREVAVPGVERLAADTADGVRPLAEHLLLLRLPLAARLPPRIAQVVAQR